MACPLSHTYGFRRTSSASFNHTRQRRPRTCKVGSDGTFVAFANPIKSATTDVTAAVASFGVNSTLSSAGSKASAILKPGRLGDTRTEVGAVRRVKVGDVGRRAVFEVEKRQPVRRRVDHHGEMVCDVRRSAKVQRVSTARMVAGHDE